MQGADNCIVYAINRDPHPKSADTVNLSQCTSVAHICYIFQELKTLNFFKYRDPIRKSGGIQGIRATIFVLSITYCRFDIYCAIGKISQVFGGLRFFGISSTNRYSGDICVYKFVSQVEPMPVVAI